MEEEGSGSDSRRQKNTFVEKSGSVLEILRMRSGKGRLEGSGQARRARRGHIQDQRSLWYEWTPSFTNNSGDM